MSTRLEAYLQKGLASGELLPEDLEEYDDSPEEVVPVKPVSDWAARQEAYEREKAEEHFARQRAAARLKEALEKFRYFNQIRLNIIHAVALSLAVYMTYIFYTSTREAQGPVITFVASAAFFVVDFACVWGFFYLLEGGIGRTLTCWYYEKTYGVEFSAFEYWD